MVFKLNGLINSFFIVLVVFLAFSCNDDDSGTPNDQEAPSIEIFSPTANSIFESGEDINVEINFTDMSEIVSYTVKVINTVTQEEVYNKNAFPSNKSATEAFQLTIEVDEPTLFNIQVKAIDDFDNIYDSVAGSFTVNRKVGGDLSLDFNVNYDGQNFKLFENYTYPSGGTIYFTRLSFYMSDIKLSSADGTILTKDVDFVNMTSFYENPPSDGSGYSYLIKNIESGSYNNLNFNVGLSNELNENSPSAYPTTHPLGLTSEHWPGWNSYVYFKLEGKIDFESDGTFDDDVALHIGGVDNSRNISKDANIIIEDQEQTSINLNFDINKVFVSPTGEIYDIAANPEIHNLNQNDQVIELADNVLAAMQ